jgi:hypothetical protein
MYEVKKYIQKSVQEALKALTPEQAEALMQLWITAGYGDAKITDDVLASMGLKDHLEMFEKQIKGWESRCYKTFIAITGERPQNCRLMGRGFRSQWFGKAVAEAIKTLRDGVPSTYTESAEKEERVRA